MKLNCYHLGFAVLFSLAVGLFLGSEIGISVADTVGRDYIELEAEVTAYSPSPHITQGDPFQMASGKKATVQDLEQLRYVAVSRDLIEGGDIKWGDIIYIGFEVQDTMAAKVTNTVDLFMRNLDLARKFGRQERKIIILRQEDEVKEKVIWKK